MDTIRNLDYYSYLRAHPLVEHLLGELIHVTSISNYRSIRKDGAIRPNDGSLQGHFKRRAPMLTACERLGAVSLFNFAQPEDRVFPLLHATETIREYFVEWGQFLWIYKPLSVVLLLDKTAAAGNLSTDADCKRVSGQWIYNVEVCHKGPVPVSSIKEIVVVPSHSNGESARAFVVFEASEISDEQIRDVEVHCSKL
jgi:hypothetical protein